jgi:UDP-GlcNAc:undecaprenyl-phosphate GlcNAc-1-phosphate transferase
MALVVDPRLFPAVLQWGDTAATPIVPAAFAVLFVVASVGIVNAVNMADGGNGIVGSMFAVWSICLLIAGDATTHFAAVAIVGSSLVFLAYNLRGRLFLGDCGAYGVTFAIGIMAAAAHATGRLPLETLCVWFALPVLDCLRLIAIRIRRKRSPFSPDREHLHHILEVRFGQRPALLIYVGAIASTSAIATVEPSFSLGCLIALAAGFIFFTRHRSLATEIALRGPWGIRES